MIIAVHSARIFIKLALYFTALFVTVAAIGRTSPDLFGLMPFGGNHALSAVGIDGNPMSLFEAANQAPAAGPAGPFTLDQLGALGLYLSFTLGGTILVMLPVAWTYEAIKTEAGFRKSFVRALLVLPICAAAIVLLIQNSLALAFGLAAMVAAVRFRVALQEAIDGIFIFSAICVGLAAGIGHLGIASFMALFFCFANAILWKIRFGENPLDQTRIEKKKAKL